MCGAMCGCYVRAHVRWCSSSRPGREPPPLLPFGSSSSAVVSLAFSVLCFRGRDRVDCVVDFASSVVDSSALRYAVVGAASMLLLHQRSTAQRRRSAAQHCQYMCEGVRRAAVCTPRIQLRGSDARRGQARATCAARAAAAPAAAARATSLESAIQPLDLT